MQAQVHLDTSFKEQRGEIGKGRGSGLLRSRPFFALFSCVLSSTFLVRRGPREVFSVSSALVPLVGI